MLVQFKLSNCFSYKDEQTFSLLAGSDRSHEANCVPEEISGYRRLLKCALLYGANASGKSNLLKSLALLQSIVAGGHALQQGQRLTWPWYRLDAKEGAKPSAMEVVFIEEGVRYAYGLSYRDTAIEEEYLYHWPEGRKALIFERKGDRFKFTKEVEEQKRLAARAIPILPYLSVATQWNLALVVPAFRWLTQRLVVVAGDVVPGSAGYLNPAWRKFSASRVDTYKSEMLDLMRGADFSITDLQASSRKPTDAEIPPILLPEIRESLKGGEVWDILAFHPGLDASGARGNVPLSLTEESLGTQRFFELAGPWLDILKADKVCLMDEFDTGLHPELAEHLLSQFLSRSHAAQFVFTTHNTNHLAADLLRRDQFWITEIAAPEKGTELFSLAELGLRNDHNLEKGYLAGKYGGIPLTVGP